MLATVNHELEQVHGFADFLAQCVRDTNQANITGVRLVDAFANPDGRERGDALKTFPLDVAVSTIERARKDAVALAVKAGRIARLREMSTGDRRAQCDAVLTGYAAEITRKFEALCETHEGHWDAYNRSDGKAHVSGSEQAELGIDESSWTKSRKGRSATLRNEQNREIRDNNRSGADYAAQVTAEICDEVSDWD